MKTPSKKVRKQSLINFMIDFVAESDTIALAKMINNVVVSEFPLTRYPRLNNARKLWQTKNQRTCVPIVVKHAAIFELTSFYVAMIKADKFDRVSSTLFGFTPTVSSIMLSFGYEYVENPQNQTIFSDGHNKLYGMASVIDFIGKRLNF